MNSLNDRIELNNGVKMPGLGLGVFQITDEATAEVVEKGIASGYRLIDTAQIYGNEVGTGLGIARGLASQNLSREDIFVTSKVWNDHLSYDETLTAYQQSLERLGLDYLDLYLIHWPGDDSFKESWRALETLYHEGKVRAIGVSNFQVHHLEELAKFATVKPVLNQIELHPKLSQQELRSYADNHEMKIQAWSPLMQGQMLANDVVKALAEKYQKTPAQIILRWDLQNDIMLVVKSVHEDRMKSNADIFDFELAPNDMEILNNLNENLRVGPNPDEFDF